jgi:hypothetical protein
MHKSRLGTIVIDCCTDDLSGAADFWARAPGAKRVAQVKRWWVLEAVTGQRFCVVRPQRPDFDAHANSWSE